jgi:hypothetical protein
MLIYGQPKKMKMSNNKLKSLSKRRSRGTMREQKKTGGEIEETADTTKKSARKRPTL